MFEVGQLISGKWSPGTGGRELTVVNPRDDQPVTRVPVSAPEDVTAAVHAAREVAIGWERAPAPQRGAALPAAADAIDASAGHLADIMSAEMGKPAAEALD